MNGTYSKQKIQSEIVNILEQHYNVSLQQASYRQLYESLVMLVNEIMLKKKKDFNGKVNRERAKKVHYLCMEYLLGKSLQNTLFNLELDGIVKSILQENNVDINDVYYIEPDAALGNGGLGRLAACFLDSLSAMGYPATAHGIKYEYGLFKQKIVDGEQTILPDSWLSYGNVWLNPRPDKAVTVKFGGTVKEEYNRNGKIKPHYYNFQEVEAFPYDFLISGYDSPGVAVLELWEAKSLNKFDMKMFSQGDYAKAVAQENEVSLISKVLYPADDHVEGKTLRLKQQYFLVSAALQSIINGHIEKYRELKNLPNQVAVHINDTHPALCIPELMRILMDEYDFEWDKAWEYVTKMVSYTNHTILFEALEQWDEQIFKSLLPRIYSIIKEINRRFVSQLMEKETDTQIMSRLSLINNSQIKMANLAVLASHKINGVSELHSDIIKNKLFADFSLLYPEKFLSITNGIAHRRFLCQANPQLTEFLVNSIGDVFYKDPQKLINFKTLAEDKTALKTLDQIKLNNKKDFAEFLYRHQGVVVDPYTRFDVQIKRIHEYKRQLLNVLKIIYLYNELKQNPTMEFTPQTFFFGGKAASTYYIANRTIKLINQLACEIDKDVQISSKLKVVFIENYNVSIAEKIIPASDVSEQISLAGKEASGTGNMKFMINGALTLGTYDGANIEMTELCGSENIFIFGMDVLEVEKLWKKGYNPKQIYQNNGKLKSVLDSLVAGFNGESFEDIYNYLLNDGVADPYMCLADFDSYITAHYKMDQVYKDKQQWQKMCVLNIANAGYFSSDRSIKEYATKIWKLKKY